MTIRALLSAAVLSTSLVLAACDGADTTAEAPAPTQLTRDAIGYYCNMIVADHTGPKGQIHVEGREAPVWFSSVRDAVAFTMLPEEPKRLAAIYVNDMGRADWNSPEDDTWINAREAWFVVGSDRRGGMGAMEVVPFGEEALARGFAHEHGGTVVQWKEIPQQYVLSDDAVPVHDKGHAMNHSEPDEADTTPMTHDGHAAADGHDHTGHGEMAAD